MTNRKRLARAILTGLALLSAAGCGAVTAEPTVMPTPLPTRTVAVVATAGYEPARLVVRCNAEVSLRLTEYWGGEEVHHGICAANHAATWTDLRWGGVYLLHVSSAELGVESRQEVSMHGATEEVVLRLPGVLEVRPVPEDAEVEVDGEVYAGAVRLSYAAEECPYTATVWVRAAGYQTYGVDLRVEAGAVRRREIALQPAPTVPPTARATPRPTRPQSTPRPTAPTFTVEERVALVRQKLYESVNCMRSEKGQQPLPYIGEWEGLADEYARAWRDHFIAYGVEGLDPTPWEQQFEALGGFACRDKASLPLYAPDFYIYLGPESRWETFDMCDPSNHWYRYFQVRSYDIERASAVVIGMAPWWDGDILNAAVVIGFKW